MKNQLIYVIISLTLEGCSILVRAANSEGGAKNPSKGTSMKFLVLACDAQSGVGAGSKDQGAIHNGMWAMTLYPWRPKLTSAVDLGLTCSVVVRLLHAV